MLLRGVISSGFEYVASIRDNDSLLSLIKILDLPYIAFFGSSNAGKSSLISSLCSSANLSFSSKRPGKTKEILLFTSKNPFFHKKSFFVDFPGYGYAKASNETLEKWEIIPKFIESANIKKSYILIPSEKDLSPNDLSIIEMIQDRPFTVILTKCDKNSLENITKQQSMIYNRLMPYKNFTRKVFLTSTKSKKGMDNEKIIEEIFDIFKKHINSM